MDKAMLKTDESTMYTKKQVFELLRRHGIQNNVVDQSLEIIELAKKRNADRQRRYMQMKRETDPEFMERVRQTKSEYFQRKKAELVEKQRVKYRDNPEYREKMKTYQRDYKRAYRARKKMEDQISEASTNSGSTSDTTDGTN